MRFRACCLIALAFAVDTEVLGADELGTIRPGARCGLVVLGADPLSDIANLRHVRAVVRESDERSR